MSYLSSTKSSNTLKDIALLIVRVFVGFAMLSHGFPKLQTLLNGGEIQFMDFLGLGPKLSLLLAVFAEFVCSIFLILGLFTRSAVSFLIITMLVAAFGVHGGDEFGKKEMSLLYLALYILFLAFGAGKLSIDHLIVRRKQRNDW